MKLNVVFSNFGDELHRRENHKQRARNNVQKSRRRVKREITIKHAVNRMNGRRQNTGNNQTATCDDGNSDNRQRNNRHAQRPNYFISRR